jgi:hypothetical protein
LDIPLTNPRPEVSVAVPVRSRRRWSGIEEPVKGSNGEAGLDIDEVCGEE